MQKRQPTLRPQEMHPDFEEVRRAKLPPGVVERPIEQILQEMEEEAKAKPHVRPKTKPRHFGRRRN